MKEIPLVMHLFRKVEKGTLTLKQLTSLLKPDFSEEGTNSRKFEGDVYSIFIKYLREVASKYISVTGTMLKFSLTFFQK